MGLRREWPNLGAISLAHSYGFSNLVTPLLLHGIPLILPGSALPEAVRRAAALVPALTLPGVPALWRAWHEADAIPPHTRLALSAGAPLPLPLETAVFARRGLKLHNFYTGCERIFQMVISKLNGAPPSGFDWHRRLLDRMGVGEA